MFKNLREALRNKGIALKDYASFLGIAEKTLQNKLSGATEFTLLEVEKTMHILFPEYKWEYLFKREVE